jgi:hypothetical protein
MSDQQSEDGDSPGAQPIYPSRGPGREDMVHSYLPDEDDWPAKTQLDLTDPHAVSALQQFEKLFPEVDDLQPVIDEFVEEFLKARTSVGGDARDEYNRIFESMFGGHPDQGSKAAGAFVKALGGDLDEDD